MVHITKVIWKNIGAWKIYCTVLYGTIHKSYLKKNSVLLLYGTLPNTLCYGAAMSWALRNTGCYGPRLVPHKKIYVSNSYYLPLFFWPSSSIAFSSRQIIYLFSRHLFLSFVSQLNSFFLLFTETSISHSNILSFLWFKFQNQTSLALSVPPSHLLHPPLLSPHNFLYQRGADHEFFKESS